LPQAATTLKGKLGFAAIDAIAVPSLAEEYGIQGFPTILLFRDGVFREVYKG